MNKIVALLASLVFVVLVAAGASCGSDGDVCALSETQACDATYDTCIENAAATANRAACTQCAKNLCNCYDKCGTSCDENDYNGVCGN